MHENLVIIGASGHGKVVADIAMKLGTYKKINFLDDDTSLKQSMGIPVTGKCSEVFGILDSSDIFVAIGNATVRQTWITKLQEADAHIPLLIHPSAVVGMNVKIGCGSVVMAGAVINPDAILGRGCIVNTCASVDHECILGEYVHIAVGAHLAGSVHVGQNTWIGAGAVVKNNVSICNDCMIGAGAVVVKDITSPGIYMGVPAKEYCKRE